MGIDPADHDEMAAMATKIMAEVVDTMRHRAAEVSEGAAARLSQRTRNARPVSVRPLASLEAAELAGTTTVRWRHGLVATIDHHDARVVLRLPDRTMTFPGPARRLFRRFIVGSSLMRIPCQALTALTRRC